MNTNTNILNAAMNLVYLLKDLTNRFFNNLLTVVETKLFIKNWTVLYLFD